MLDAQFCPFSSFYPKCMEPNQAKKRSGVEGIPKVVTCARKYCCSYDLTPLVLTGCPSTGWLEGCLPRLGRR